MDKGIIIYLDDDDLTLKTSKTLFEQHGLNVDFDLITCKTIEEFEKETKNNEGSLKCLIFDLVGGKPGKEELLDGNAEFFSNIWEAYARFNLPIFVFSGYLDKYSDSFPDCGTVFRVDKDEGINTIFDKIQLFHESGFLSVFCPNGILETEIHKEIHESFVRQFRNGEIEEIIKSVEANSTNADEYRDRCIEIFKRISIRALMNKLLSPVVAEVSNVNAIEHYYRRFSDVDFWTGDILKKNDSDDYVILLTPRCDCVDATNFLICNIEEDFPYDNKRNKIERALRDNDNFSGRSYRYLPPTPLFPGGKVNISTYKTVSKEELQSNYCRVITLSDDIANEILAKLGSYFLRTGISAINMDELISYLRSLNETTGS